MTSSRVKVVLNEQSGFALLNLGEIKMLEGPLKIIKEHRAAASRGGRQTRSIPRLMELISSTLFM